ncbi:Mu homology domain-containing protein [Lobosporangium transversale]|uniref:Coatomer subunit delta n=1 Tax=Lobosporangium transversale TaxID=64571 RepID=A0A1Y2GHH4_9FUNG|nr:Mu homology domain-containing protein [Lobosporangium transversale]ORZ11048.1 Mu homology domain-containing protein [Lobosporangium transversale]|eukprot:XP_021879565.1 Mu homology domain-containing protein [Lobosporangium transversale]
MVVLAISVCTKSGKALISRQFREMTRARIEGLIASFPKLTSNIDTLQLVSRVVSSICRPTDAREIDRNAFELLSSENVNLAQVASISEMESHEEKIQEMIEKNKEREAKEELKRRAKILDLAEEGAAKEHGRHGRHGMGGGYGQGMGGGYGQSPMGFGSQSGNQGYESPVPSDDGLSRFNNPAPKAAPATKARGMQLGRKQNNTDLFESLRSEVESVPVSQQQQPQHVPAQSNYSAPTQPDFPMESVHVHIEEKITMVANRDGGLENMEVKGDLMLRVSDPSFTKISLSLSHLDDSSIQFKTHPNVNKVLFNSNKVIAFRDSSKEFPLNNSYRINCWPSPAGDGSCDAMEFKNVNIIIPIPQGTSPTVGEADGHTCRSSSNPSGTLEFNCQGEDAESFFPVSVQFESSVTAVTLVADGSEVVFSKQSILTPIEYSVV